MSAVLVEEIDREIAEIEKERAAIQKALKTTQDAAKKDDRSLAAKARALRKARALVSGEQPMRSAGAKAGKESKAAVARLMSVHDVLTQAEVTKLSGQNSGSVAYALRALEDEGVIKDTGKRVGRSREFAYVAKGV